MSAITIDDKIIGLLSGQPEEAIARSASARSMGALLIRDSLTGLFNRAYLQHRLSLELTGDSPFSLAVIDLNGFKWINDTHGHPAGDQVLVTVAALVAAAIGDQGFGGDEFVVGLPGLTAPEAQEWANRLIAALDRTQITFDSGGSITGIGARIGIAATPPADATDVASLFHAADQAMYLAKRQRASSTCLFSDVTNATTVIGPLQLPRGPVALVCGMIDGLDASGDAEQAGELARRLQDLIAGDMRQFDGILLDTPQEGRGFRVAFARCYDAVSAVALLQSVMHAQPLMAAGGVEIRLAVHMGLGVWRNWTTCGPRWTGAARSPARPRPA